MYMNQFLLNFAILLIACDINSQIPLVKKWDKRFGGTDVESLWDFQKTSDGGYILGGDSRSDIGGDITQSNWDTSLGTADYWIIKLDSFGNKEWDRRFGGLNEEYFTSLINTKDGGYLLGGSSNSGISGDKTQLNWDTSNFNTDFWIVKIDSIGTKKWDKRFGGLKSEFLQSLIETSDNGYLLGGYCFSENNGDKSEPSWSSNSDYWIVKIDSLGVKQWDRRFGGYGSDHLFDLKQTKNGGYILAGNSTSDVSGDKTEPVWGTLNSSDYWIVKIDSLGKKEWDKRFGGTHADYCNSIELTLNGGFILGGVSQSDIGGDKTEATWGGFDYWIIKIDSLGNKEWDRDYGGILAEFSYGNISNTLDNGYLLAGDSYSPASGEKSENNLGSIQSWILKIDSFGNKEWDKTLFTSSNSLGDAMGYAIQINDSCYTMANFTGAGIGGYKSQSNWNEDESTRDFWLIKFCDSTIMTNASFPFISKSQITYANNPFTTDLTINCGSGEIVLFDLVGKVFFRQKVQQGLTKINTESLPVGLYILCHNDGKTNTIQKLTKI